MPAPPSHTRFVSPYSYEWFVRAELLQARAEYAAAAEAYRSALSSADDDPYLLARLARALDLAGERESATRELKNALALDPRSEAAWLELGRSAERHGELEPALLAFTQAEAVAPRSPEGPLALAALLQRQRQPERALEVLERFAARSEQGSLPWLRARLELARSRGDGAALAEAAAAWLAHGGGHVELLQQLARELSSAGQHALALHVLEALPEAERDPRLVLEADLASMRTAEAELLLRTATPAQLGGPLAIAEAYLRIGQPQRALEALEERDTGETAEDDATRRALLQGLAWLDSGQYARAALWLARVPKGSAYYERARLGLERALGAAGLPALAHELASQAQ